jgi:hypothetical protein
VAIFFGSGDPVWFTSVRHPDLAAVHFIWDSGLICPALGLIRVLITYFLTRFLPSGRGGPSGGLSDAADCVYGDQRGAPAVPASFVIKMVIYSTDLRPGLPLFRISTVPSASTKCDFGFQPHSLVSSYSTSRLRFQRRLMGRAAADFLLLGYPLVLPDAGGGDDGFAILRFKTVGYRYPCNQTLVTPS